MSNHDVALVIALWAIAAITYGLILLHERHAHRPRTVRRRDDHETDGL